MTLELAIYKKFIEMESIVGRPQENKSAIKFVKDFLEALGFNIRILAENKSEQPTIIAHYTGRSSTSKVTLYGHYDVAQVKDLKSWVSENPFQLENINGRLYGRGIADNKGPLLARMLALRSLILSDKPVPEVMWLIQGEEEILEGKRVAHDIFKREIPVYGAQVYIEETGFNDLDTNTQIAFLWSPELSEKELTPWHRLLEKSLGNPRIEYRHLNKLNGSKDCPLLSNLPKNSVYIGFGPNDRLHFIHRDNESLDARYLLKHQQQFESFLANFATYCHA